MTRSSITPHGIPKLTLLWHLLDIQIMLAIRNFNLLLDESFIYLAIQGVGQATA